MQLEKLIQSRGTSSSVGIIIDELTPCLVHRESGEEYKTIYEPLLNSDLKQLTKNKGWVNFNWKHELSISDRHVFKLLIKGSDEIQGLISFEVAEGYIDVFLVESAPWNVGSSDKVFIGVGAHLFAIACKFSFEYGFEGVVAFTSKTNLIEHYQVKLGAIIIGGHLMAIETARAKELVDIYFREEEHT
ncbi:hypothetical protein [Paenibacillus polymyxa]|uniref:hypothetical protein n=1 Tax=Paenibacillus polymyxa TaxID=1406 RepID=UPI0025B62EBD|nr:hypothetical protein [Paenibacillus polymyxa]MDN4106665.1 hypothetical protein [Paenibacillus polymyxa]